MNRPVHVLIVDDEPLARRGLRRFLERDSRTECVGEAGNGLDAIERIETIKPDIVLLDIEMPELSGLEVVEHIGVNKMPIVIFVTAYDQYAVKAFEIHAVDYLMKPVKVGRLDEAIKRAIEKLRSKESEAHKLEEVLSHMRAHFKRHSEIPTPRRLVVRYGNTSSLVEISDIEWITAAGNYVEVRTSEKRHLLRSSVKSMERRLRSYGFYRISRSIIVNSRYVVECISQRRECPHVRMRGGQILRSSRSYRPNLDEMLSESV